MNIYLEFAKICKICVFTTILSILMVLPVVADDGVPTEILNRTICIGNGPQQATGFFIDHRGKLYLVTARHFATGLPDTNATIKWRKSGSWFDLKTVRTIYPSSSDVDIAIFEITLSAKSGNLTMGQQVYFLGFPWGIGSKFGTKSVIMTEAPFIKRGTMSAVDGSDPNAVVMYIDGFNNPGFSGGPLVYWDFNDRKCRIFGVVKGYRKDRAKITVNGEDIETNILVNSGILIGYSISHVIETLNKLAN